MPTHKPLKNARSALSRACALAGVAASFAVPLAFTSAAPVEPPLVTTAHPVLVPSSAITLPLEVRADDVSVWREGSEQRMFLKGDVRINVGYRQLRAAEAAVFLTPTQDGGENTFDVAIYLKGDVTVSEGVGKKATVTRSGDELLVTTRITKEVQLSGGTPRAQAMEENPVVARGDKLRNELLTRPPQLVHVPVITITETEKALQRGWIARGPGNKIVVGPGEALALQPGGEGTTAGQAPPLPPPKVTGRPQILATADEVSGKVIDGEQVVVARGNFFLMRTTPDEKPPIILRAQHAVLFSPQGGADAATQPAGADRSLPITAAYVEGDVTIEYGTYTVRATRIFYDFTTDRAIMLDAVLSTYDETRNVPVYIRADELRQLARGEYHARSVRFSTSEFYTPHYHIGASSAYLQEITPQDETGAPVGQGVYAFRAKDITFNARNVPFFYWPYLTGDTRERPFPLQRLRAGYSRRYGMTLETDWNLFQLLGMTAPEGTRAKLNLDYWGKRGPGIGVDATRKTDDSESLLRSYLLQDRGDDRLGRDRKDLDVPDETRGRITARHRQQLDEKWSLTLEADYISDPNFLEQYFINEFESDKEHETVVYLKRAGETDAFTILGKFYLYDFTANADLVDDQFATEKKPEIKYWRIGDRFLDVFTYYAENGVANVEHMFTDYPPSTSGLQSLFPMIPAGQTFREYYRGLGWRDGSVLRADSRHEITMPFQMGDVKIAPYVTGRITAWDEEFPESAGNGSTVRLWGAAGVRTSMQFWRVYENVRSGFWDINGIRHIIEPQVNVFIAGSNEHSADLQPYDRDVEGISDISAVELTLRQKFQTKRGVPGNFRNVDWLVINTSFVSYFDDPEKGPFFRGQPLRGAYFYSRPELSLVRDSVYIEMIRRIGERVRWITEANINLEDGRLEHYANGLIVDQSPHLAWFLGNRYVNARDSSEWTLALDYKLTEKYNLIAAQSYDTGLSKNIFSSVTLVRKFPRLTGALTVSYDANVDDVSFVVSVWPEGFPEVGIGSSSLRSRGPGN